MFKFALATFAVVSASDLFDEKRVAEINNMKLSWKASTEQGRFFNNMTLDQFKSLLGTRLEGGPTPVYTKHDSIPDSAVPDSFDSRTNWANCPTISHIRDQSACGSCWAFGAVESMSDRYCTYKVNANLSISADNLNSCCKSCGNGCNGGFPGAAWEYWVKTGLTTEDCDPYPFPTCEHHIPQGNHPVCPSQIYNTPACKSSCKDGSDMKKFHGAKTITVSGEADIQKEIMTNGPVEVAFTVYKDFESYKSGVYTKTSDQALGGHAVRMVGWGVWTDSTPYWIVANSWNPDWGMNGFFLIKRGNNECGIESTGWAGEPASA
jgi:C1A family cysteine protease